MTDLEFSMTFHSWFRVGSSFGRDGRDLAIDHHEPIHGDHLKGLMRDAAESQLKGTHLVDNDLIDRVFGTTKQGSSWSWTSALPKKMMGSIQEVQWDFTDRHRVRIDREAQAAQKDMLVRAEVAWTPKATFQVIWCGSEVEVDKDELAHQQALLSVAGSAVHHLGSWRRRGLGWVGIQPIGRVLDDDLTMLTTAKESTP